MTTQGIIFSAFFILVYGYIAFFQKYRGYVIWAVILMAFATTFIVGEFPGLTEIGNIFAGVNYSVLMIFAGILLIAEILIEVGIPAYLAAHIAVKARNYGHAALWLCVLSSGISIFVENVATVMIVAPIAFEVSKKLRANPIPLIIGIAIASNLQGTATLVGDPPSMILAAAEQMNFNDFIWMNGKPGIFFAVQAGALFSCLVLLYFFKKDNRHIPDILKPEVTSWFPAWVLGGVILGLAGLSFVFPGVGLEAGILCLFGGVITMVWHALCRRGHVCKSNKGEYGSRRTRKILSKFDYDTVLLLFGIFFLIGTLTQFGVMDVIGGLLADFAGGNPFSAFLIVIVSAVVFSAFIDNVPFVAAMIPITMVIGESLGYAGQEHLYLTFGLLMGACLGGNISPVGASANIVGVSMLRKNGYKVTFWEFVKIGLPFTIAAVVAGSAFIWFVWGPK